MSYGWRYTHVTRLGYRSVQDRIQILAQVERLTGSHALRDSESLRKLLHYLAVQSLDHPGETIKEYQIATEVLGRQSDFDPQLNSLVRVQAGRLRTKLTEYYSAEGAQDAILVDFPKGTYVLSFRERHPNGDTAARLHEEHFDAHHQPANVPSQDRWKTIATLLALGLLGSLLLIGYVVIRKPAAPAAVQQPEVPAAIRIFWRGFLTGPDDPWIVFSNAAFVGHPDSGLRYYKAERDGQTHIFDHYTGVGEVLAVHALDGVFQQLNRGLRVKRGSLFSLDDARNNDLIFVGSPSENLTLLEIPSTHEFVFRSISEGPRKGDTEIINVHPVAGEPKEYLATGSSEPLTEDYSVVALVKGLNSSRSILILAGTTTIGTQAAAEFVSRKDELGELLKRLSATSPAELKPFEAVIRTRVSHGVPVESRIVSIKPSR